MFNSSFLSFVVVFFFFWIPKVRGGEDLQEELDPVALLVLLC